MSPEADALKEEGLRLFRIGEHTQALDHFEQAYDAYMAAERPLDAAEMLKGGWRSDCSPKRDCPAAGGYPT